MAAGLRKAVFELDRGLSIGRQIDRLRLGCDALAVDLEVSCNALGFGVRLRERGPNANRELRHGQFAREFDPTDSHIDAVLNFPNQIDDPQPRGHGHLLRRVIDSCPLVGIFELPRDTLLVGQQNDFAGDVVRAAENLHRLTQSAGQIG